jgi:hypothetical protein
VGQTVCCPKCETYFNVDEPEDAEAAASSNKKPVASKAVASTDEDFDDEQPRKKKKKKRSREEDVGSSYKNSPIRFAILGVLIIVLIVLGYMLYLKKQREAKDNAAAEVEKEEKEKPIRPMEMRVQVNEAVLNELRAQLVGKWSGKDPNSQVVFTINYKKSGEFEIGTEEQPKMAVGAWKAMSEVRALGSDKPRGLMVQLTLANDERGMPVQVLLDPNGVMRQALPFIAPNKQGIPPMVTFTRVKEID